jgi:peptide chain release factor subunit 1
MAVQAEEEIRDLAGYSHEGFLVTSFYVNVDATEFTSDAQADTSFSSLIHDAESRRKDIEEALSHDAVESLRHDLAKIREFFDGGVDRDAAKSFAIFSCSADEFWQVIPMSLPVMSQVHFKQSPVLSPIATFLSHTKPTAILLTNQQQARIFTMEGGEVREWTDFESWVPTRSANGGWSQNRYQRRNDVWAKHHIDHATELTLRLLQHYPFDWLVLGVDVAHQNELQNSLHPYLKDRMIGYINVRLDAPAPEIIEAAEALREETESKHIDTLIGQVQEFAGAGGRGSIGLKDTLRAVNEQKVHILMVQDGFAAAGAECPNCGLLMPSDKATCEACNEATVPVANVVDSAVQKAFELGSTVEVAIEPDKLAPVENIAAILYY